MPGRTGSKKVKRPRIVHLPNSSVIAMARLRMPLSNKSQKHEKNNIYIEKYECRLYMYMYHLKAKECTSDSTFSE